MHAYMLRGVRDVACAQVVEEEGLQENCAVVGAQLIAGFRRLAEKHAIIGDVRGAGLMLGVELVKDRQSKV
jgi:alanine-glyoxylate transaminase / (R)-3-amino-2-methylpropionate-pyruvate transaminase